MTRKTKDVLFYGALFLGVALLLLLEWKKSVLLLQEPYGQMWYDTLSRLIASFLCIAMLCRFSMSHLLMPKKPILRPFLVILPCFAIAINNFPFLSVGMGDATLGSGVSNYVMYALLCLSVGLFEEVAFRGCVFTVSLERIKNIQQAPLRVLVSCVVSSALFGLVHLTNLLAGASVGYVILQVGYSFLIGGMCAIIMVKTSHIWYGVLLHAVYNFAGGILPAFGLGQIWTVPTIILTAVVSVMVACYVFYVLFHIRPEEIERLLKGKKATKTSSV